MVRIGLRIWQARSADLETSSSGSEMRASVRLKLRLLPLCFVSRMAKKWKGGLMGIESFSLFVCFALLKLHGAIIGERRNPVF